MILYIVSHTRINICTRKIPRIPPWVPAKAIKIDMKQFTIINSVLMDSKILVHSYLKWIKTNATGKIKENTPNADRLKNPIKSSNPSFDLEFVSSLKISSKNEI